MSRLDFFFFEVMTLSVLVWCTLTVSPIRLYYIACTLSVLKHLVMDLEKNNATKLNFLCNNWRPVGCLISRGLGIMTPNKTFLFFVGGHRSSAIWCNSWERSQDFSPCLFSSICITWWSQQAIGMPWNDQEELFGRRCGLWRNTERIF